MKVIIPAAGIGKRLRPVTLYTPKVLMKVAGKPMIDHIISYLTTKLNVNEIIMIVGYLRNKLEKYLSRKYANKLQFHFPVQHERLGLAHAINLAKPYIDNEDVLIILGDTIVEGDIAKNILEAKSKKINKIGVYEVDNPSRFGVVKLEGNKIVGMVEKPSPEEAPSNMAIIGLYYIHDSNTLFKAIDRIISENIKTKGEYQLTDALQLMLEEGSTFEAMQVPYWLDTGKLETILSSQSQIINLKYSGKAISSKAQIENSLIIPPVVIKHNVVIKNSIIGPNVSIGRNTHITNSIIKHSVIANNVVINDSNIIESYIDSNVEISYIKLKESIIPAYSHWLGGS